MLIVLAIGGIVIATLILSPLFRTRFSTRSRIITFHSLRPLLWDFAAVSSNTVARFLDECAGLGLQCGTIEEAQRRTDTVALTFDDGYDDVMEALPLITERRLAATIFIPTKFIGEQNSWDNFLLRGKRTHLSHEQIRKLAAAGVQFGSHSHTHRDLTSLDDKTLREELEQSKRILEELTGRQVRYLAYPFGRSDSRVAEMARAVGYEYCLWSSPRRADRCDRGRIPINRFDTPLTIRAKLRPGILSGAEYLKISIISRFSHLTPLLANFRTHSGSR